MSHRIRYYFFFVGLVFLITGCTSLSALMKRGEVAQKNFLVSIPFESRKELIIVKVKIDGQTYHFLVDTGACNILSEELAQKLQLSTVATIKIQDSQNNTAKSRYVRIPDLEIAGVHFLNSTALVANLSSTPGISCLKIDGIVGSNLMQKAIWQFDFPHQQITFASHADSLPLQAAAFQIPFHTAGEFQTPKIEVSYDGVTEKSVKIDFGSNDGFDASGATLDKIRTLRPDLKRTTLFGSYKYGLFGGAAKKDSTHYAGIQRISMKNTPVFDQTVRFLNKRSSKIGMRYWKNFVVTLNWTTHMLALTPVHQVSDSTFTRSSFGFMPQYKEGKVYVGAVFVGSPASRAGLVVGDQIVSLNGSDYTAVSEEQWCDIYLRELINPAWEEIQLDVRNIAGEQKTLRLKKAEPFLH